MPRPYGSRTELLVSVLNECGVPTSTLGKPAEAPTEASETDVRAALALALKRRRYAIRRISGFLSRGAIYRRPLVVPRSRNLGRSPCGHGEIRASLLTLRALSGLFPRLFRRGADHEDGGACRADAHRRDGGNDCRAKVQRLKLSSPTRVHGEQLTEAVEEGEAPAVR